MIDMLQDYSNGVRARVEISQVVRVSLRGHPHPDGFPHLPDDYGLVQDFIKWMREEDIHEAFLSSSGGGQYVGYFHPSDLKKVTDRKSVV